MALPFVLLPGMVSFRYLLLDAAMLLAIIDALERRWLSAAVCGAAMALALAVTPDRVVSVMLMAACPVLVRLLSSRLSRWTVGRDLSLYAGAGLLTLVVVFRMLGRGSSRGLVHLLRNVASEYPLIFGLPMPGFKYIATGLQMGPWQRLGVAVFYLAIFTGIMAAVILPARWLLRRRPGRGVGAPPLAPLLPVLATSVGAVPTAVLRSDLGHISGAASRFVLLGAILAALAARRLLRGLGIERGFTRTLCAAGAVLGFVAWTPAARTVLDEYGLSLRCGAIEAGVTGIGQQPPDPGLNDVWAGVADQAVKSDLREMTRFIAGAVPPERPIFDLNAGLMSYLTDRRNPTRYCITYDIPSVAEELDSVRRIEAAGRPLAIIRSGEWWDYTDNLRSEYRFTHLGEYLFDSYVPTRRIGGYVIAEDARTATPDWSVLQGMAGDMELGDVPRVWGEHLTELFVIDDTTFRLSRHPEVSNSHHVVTTALTGGALRVEPCGDDPFVVFRHDPIDGAGANLLVLTLRCATTCGARLFYYPHRLKPPDGRDYECVPSAAFTVTGSESPRTYVFRVAAMPLWRWGGTIDALRLDLAEDGRVATIDVESWELLKARWRATDSTRPTAAGGK